MTLSNRECSLCEIEKRTQPSSIWIVACGHPECIGILADETEATPYVAKLERVADCAIELCEVAYHRGDNILPHPEDDPLLWTARMQTAWDEIAEALKELE